MQFNLGNSFPFNFIIKKWHIADWNFLPHTINFPDINSHDSKTLKERLPAIVKIRSINEKSCLNMEPSLLTSPINSRREHSCFLSVPLHQSFFSSLIAPCHF